ncbi:MAG: tRNA (adenosine(37)-N6)-threonylcarbamoyltransferase complex ATPase subunit type 1 TsaE [Candidatus Gracilibacteria bacterium]|nr:tRNA (adenosine(37)-N6)-threonylcarbamoyltransferase complex ATPase subunit type 1 TsaE [Candidatus Gracilibacteria bacterium]
MQYTTQSPEETQKLAKTLLPNILNKKIIHLAGNLGSGKTTFVKGIGKALGINKLIKSPTYTYTNTYQIKTPNSKLKTLHHFDLYRLPEHLENPHQTAAEIGLDNAINNPEALVIIEWPERIPHIKALLQITFEQQKDHHVIRLNIC